MISAHSMFLAVNQFAQCIKSEWKQCSSFSPPATVILLLFLTFEALLFAVFTMIMLGTQLSAIWNDQTVRNRWDIFFIKLVLSIFRLLLGYRAVEKGRGKMGEKVTLEKYSVSIWSFFIGMVFSIHKTKYKIKIRSTFVFGLNCATVFFPYFVNASNF